LAVVKKVKKKKTGLTWHALSVLLIYMPYLLLTIPVLLNE